MRLRDGRAASRFGGSLPENSDGGRRGTSRSTEGQRGELLGPGPSPPTPGLPLWRLLLSETTSSGFLHLRQHFLSFSPKATWHRPNHLTLSEGVRRREQLCTQPPACPLCPHRLLSSEVTGSAGRGRRNVRLWFKSNLSCEAGLEYCSYSCWAPFAQLGAPSKEQILHAL